MTKQQRSCLSLISLAGGRMNHDDKRLEPYCDEDDAPVDVFNQCHNAGWLTSSHDDRDDSSTVYLTQAGSYALLSAS